jgi:hypothetical protein
MKLYRDRRVGRLEVGVRIPLAVAHNLGT